MTEFVALRPLLETIKGGLLALPYDVYVAKANSFAKQMFDFLRAEVPEELVRALTESFVLIEAWLPNVSDSGLYANTFERWAEMTDDRFDSRSVTWLCYTVMALVGELGGVSPRYSAADIIHEPLSRRKGFNGPMKLDPEGSGSLVPDPDALVDASLSNVQLLQTLADSIAAR